MKGEFICEHTICKIRDFQRRCQPVQALGGIHVHVHVVTLIDTGTSIYSW